MTGATIITIGSCDITQINDGAQYLQTGIENETYNWRKTKQSLPKAYLNIVKEWKNCLTTTDETPEDAMNIALKMHRKATDYVEYNSLKKVCREILADENLKSRKDLIDALSEQIETWEGKLAPTEEKPKEESRPASLKESFSPTNYAETQQGKQIAVNALRFAMRNAFGRG